MFTIYGANLKNSAGAADWLKRRSLVKHPGHFHIALTSEAQSRRVRNKLNSCRNHDYFTGPPRQSNNDAGRETGILLANSLDYKGEGSYWLSPFDPSAPKVAKERWGQIVVTQLGDRRVAVINVHPTWPGDREGTRLLELHDMAIRWATLQIRMFDDLDVECVLGSDINMRKNWDSADKTQKMVDRFRLKGVWNGLDMLVCTPGLEVRRAEVREGILPDHPLTVLGVDPK